MKMRSTGLGETVLEGELDKITRKDDYLILHINTIEPVQWHIRSAIDFNDLLILIKLILKVILKGPVLKFLFFGIKNWRHPRDTDDF
jgi:hypothetical protein